MFTYRNARNGDEVTYSTRSVRLDHLPNWSLVSGDTIEGPEQPQQPETPENPEGDTDGPVERFGRPQPDATLADLKGFAKEHGIHLEATAKAAVATEIEDTLSTVETMAAVKGVEVEGRRFADVAEELQTILDGEDTDGDDTAEDQE